MLTIVLALGCGILYLVAYHTYGRWLARRIFNLDANAPVPSKAFEDGTDHVPTHKSVVFGHHFTSIAGTGPIVGPAIAIIWGWVPAVLWVLIGSIFMGAVHDFGSMVVSLRNRGYSIGDLTGNLINPRARILFSLIIFFELLIVIAIFGLVIAAIFAIFPSSVWPVWLQIPIAIGLGIVVRKMGGGTQALFWGALVALALMYATVWLGSLYPVTMPEFLGKGPVFWWTVLLLIYAFIASVLPVQWLLQPRDFINSNQLIAALALIILGVVVARPEMVAPAVQTDFAGAEKFPIFPFLFITIACGAISGFHCLVGSGTSSKQARSESDAKLIGFGSMLTEGYLAILVIIAVAAGLGLTYQAKIPAAEMAAFQFAYPANQAEAVAGPDGQVTTYQAVLSGSEAWTWHYRSWSAGSGLGEKVGAFVTGSANMMNAFGIPMAFAIALMGVFVASFAGTTLDTATRLQRYIISELSSHSPATSIFANRYVATSIAVITGGWLALRDGQGKGAMILWPLFGATNQLLAAMALVAVSVYLYRRNKPTWMVVIPMIFMVVMTATAMTFLIRDFMNPDTHAPLIQLVLGVIILILEVWLVIEAVLVWLKLRGLSPEERALDPALATPATEPMMSRSEGGRAC